MLLGGLAELHGHMLERSFGKYVDDLAATRGDPVHRGAAVDEAEDLDAVEVSLGGGPFAYARESLGLPFRDTCGRDFDAVHAELFEEQLGDGQLLVHVERYTGGLLAVTQGGVKYL